VRNDGVQLTSFNGFDGRKSAIQGVTLDRPFNVSFDEGAMAVNRLQSETAAGSLAGHKNNHSVVIGSLGSVGQNDESQPSKDKLDLPSATLADKAVPNADIKLAGFQPEVSAEKGARLLFDQWIKEQLAGRYGNSPLQSVAPVSGELQSKQQSIQSVIEDSVTRGSGFVELPTTSINPTMSLASAIGITGSNPLDGGIKHWSTPLVIYSKQWQGDFSNKINWMIQAGLDQAEIELDPADLGPIHIRIKQTQGDVQVVVQAQQGLTRELFEQNQERLREMFQHQGLNLSQFDVQSQAHGEKQAAEHKTWNDQPTGVDSQAETDIDQLKRPATLIQSNRLLDLFV
jgi:flagellar hook-length control protein FliK